MGESKRRVVSNPFLLPGEHPVLYQKAEIVHVVPAGLTKPNPSYSDVESVEVFDYVVNEAAMIARRPGGLIKSYSSPDRVATPEELRHVIKDRVENYADLVVFDPITGDILDLVAPGAFFANYTKISNSLSRYAKIEPDSGFQIVIRGDDELSFFTADGEPIHDTPGFLEHRILTFKTGLTIIANDHPAAITTLPYNPVDPRSKANVNRFVAHLFGLAQIALDRRSQLSRYETASLNCFLTSLHGGEFCDLTQVAVKKPINNLAHAMQTVEKLASSFPDTPPVRALCAAMGTSVAVFSNVVPNGQNSEFHEDIEAALRITTKANPDDADRHVGSDAAVTQFPLTGPFNAEIVLKASSFLARGINVGSIAKGDESIEVVDIDGARYVALTNVSKNIMQLACWTRPSL